MNHHKQSLLLTFLFFASLMNFLRFILQNIQYFALLLSIFLNFQSLISRIHTSTLKQAYAYLYKYHPKCILFHGIFFSSFLNHIHRIVIEQLIMVYNSVYNNTFLCLQNVTHACLFEYNSLMTNKLTRIFTLCKIGHWIFFFSCSVNYTSYFILHISLYIE